MKQLDDVLGYPLKIYQNRDWFCFSLDSILLANFSNIKLSTKKVMDLGTGNGIIPLVLSLRTDAKIYGIDIQEDLLELARDSIQFNKLDKQIFVSNTDIKSVVNNSTMINSFDLVVSNPPYFLNYNNSIKNQDIHKTIARHEVKIKLDDIVHSASALLKNGGVFSMINKTERLFEIMQIFTKYRIEPKKIKFIYKNSNSESNMVYIEGVKNGNSGVKVLPPFIIYNINGTYSLEYSNMCKKVLR